MVHSISNSLTTAQHIHSIDVVVVNNLTQLPSTITLERFVQFTWKLLCIESPIISEPIVQQMYDVVPLSCHGADQKRDVLWLCLVKSALLCCPWKRMTFVGEEKRCWIERQGQVWLVGCHSCHDSQPPFRHHHPLDVAECDDTNHNKMNRDLVVFCIGCKGENTFEMV